MTSLSAGATLAMVRSLNTAAPQTDLVLVPVAGADTSSRIGAKRLGATRGTEGAHFGYTARTQGGERGFTAADDGTATVAIGSAAVAVETAAAEAQTGGGAWVENIGTGRFHPWRAKRSPAGAVAPMAGEGSPSRDDEGTGGVAGRDFSAGLVPGVDAVALLASGLLAGITLTVLLITSGYGADAALVAVYGQLAAQLRVLVWLLAAVLWVAVTVPLLRPRAAFALPPALVASAQLGTAVISGVFRGQAIGSISIEVCDDDVDALAASDVAVLDGGATAVATSSMALSALAMVATSQAADEGFAGVRGGKAPLGLGRDASLSHLQHAGAADDALGGMGAGVLEAAGQLHAGSDLSRPHRRAAASLLQACAEGRVAAAAVEAVLFRSADPSLGGTGSSAALAGAVGREGGAARRSGPAGGVCACAALPTAGRRGGRGCCSVGAGCCGCLSTRGLRYAALAFATLVVVFFWLGAPAEALFTASVSGGSTTGILARAASWRVFAMLRCGGALLAWILVATLTQRQRAAMRGARAAAWMEAGRRSSAGAALAVSAGEASAAGALGPAQLHSVAAAQLAAAERSRALLDATV